MYNGNYTKLDGCTNENCDFVEFMALMKSRLKVTSDDNLHDLCDIVPT